MVVEVNRRFLLEDFVLDPEKRLLSRGGRPVHLASRPFQVLLYLVERRGQLVTRAELLDRFWQGKDVYDVTLTKCIGAIRRALDDSSDHPRFIETRYAEGYRYIGPFAEQIGPRPDGAEFSQVERTRGVRVLIEEVEDPGLGPVRQAAINVTPPAPAAKAHLPAPGRHRRAVTIVVGCVAVALAVTSAILYRSRAGQQDGAPPAAVPSLAVLPLKNLTGDPAKEYLSDGLTESLISALSRISGLKVISRSSVFTFKDKDVSLQEVGRRLGVATVLEGGVRQSGDKMRVDVRLVSVPDGRVLWASDTFDVGAGDIPAIQDVITSNVAASLRPRLLTSEGEKQVAKRQAENVEAYQAYLKGRYFWNKRTPEGLRRALEYFTEAIEKDPQYAMAYSGLADYHDMSFWYVVPPASPRETAAKVREAALKALEIDPTLAEAHSALASAYAHEWDWVNAGKELEFAIRLNPGYARAHHKYAFHLGAMERWDEALREIRLAQELDPLSLPINTDAGAMLYFARRHDEAIAALKKALEIDPSYADAHARLAEAYEQKAMHDEMVAEYLEYKRLRGVSPEKVAAQREAYQGGGVRGFWQEELELLTDEARHSYIPPFQFAEIYARLGDKERAFTQIEKAYRERSATILRIKVPHMDGLRSDPRYVDLLRRAGLPPQITASN
jgi:TolB-like protein/DNA-binding winged helix-turn-helix (wHTH) protein/Tfp pilus assembly protein PilF